MTTVLVGINWLYIYYFLSLINIPFGLIASIIAAAQSLGKDCAAQSNRTTYLSIQLLTFFLYLFWCLLHVVIFKLGNIFYKPKEVDEDGNLKYDSWVQKLHEMEEEEDDD